MRDVRSGGPIHKVVAVVLVVGLGVVMASPSPRARADELSVPIELQIDLLSRVATYERNFASRQGTPAKVLVVMKRGHAESTRVAARIEAALRRTSSLGERPTTTTQHPFVDAGGLRGAVQSTGAAIVYVTPGLSAEAASIGESLDGVSVLSVSSVGSDTERGIVLGFELVAARPKLIVNIRQARRQQVEFSSQFLRLARVVQ